MLSLAWWRQPALTRPDEVLEALNDQSIIGKPGRIGRGDGSRAEALEYVLAYADRFNTPEQYENVIIRANPNGEVLRLKDVAKVVLGSEYYDIYSNLNGHPSAAIVLKQTFGSNAGEVIKNVKSELEELKKSFPPGIQYEISYDVSKFHINCASNFIGVISAGQSEILIPSVVPSLDRSRDFHKACDPHAVPPKIDFPSGAFRMVARSVAETRQSQTDE